MNPFEGLSDEKLMMHYLRGESLAFDVLYYRHKTKVSSYLARRLDNATDVGEVFQNVFLKVHKSRERYDPKYSLLQWLYTITRSELLDFLKKRRLPTDSIADDFAAPEVDENRFDLAAVPGLSEKERKVLELKYLSDLEYDEISKLLGTSPVNTRKIVSRGLAKIRKAVGRRGKL